MRYPYRSKHLPQEFLEKYKEFPDHMDPISKFTYLRTYSRDIPRLMKKESYKDTLIRATAHNIDMDKISGEPFLREEAERLFDMQFNLRGFLSGRALFTGGSTASDKFGLSLFNCSFVEPDKIENLYDVLYLLSVGAGVGYRITWDVIDKLPRFRDDVSLEIEPYQPVAKKDRRDATIMSLNGDTFTIDVGDSREGWATAVREFVKAHSQNSAHTHTKIKVSLNNVRKSGEPLKTFGGYASGPGPLINALRKINEVLTSDYRDSKGKVLTKKMVDGKPRPIHLMHIINSIGEAIVVGGVRRSAMIALFSRDDEEMVNAKTSFDDYNDPKISHYWLSNNTILVEKGYRPSQSEIAKWVEAIKNYGEPGFANEGEILRRHPYARGLNPCAEVIIRQYGLCNLTTVIMTSYIKQDGTLDMELLEKDLETLTRSSYRVTMNELELPHWDSTQKLDRLLGVSPSAWMDMVEAIGLSEENEEKLMRWMHDVIRKAADDYADKLGLSRSLNVTVVKPSGTIGLLANSTSPGIHSSHSPFYFRTIRIDKANPMYRVLKKLNWRIEDDVTRPDNTAVIYFPVKSGARRTKFDVSAIEQMERYKRFQKYYTDQNTSVTVSVQNHEWQDVVDWLSKNWDDFTAVSFLPLTDHQYQQAPYQTITEEQYLSASQGLDKLDQDFLAEHLELDSHYKEEQEADPSCATGACALDKLF